MNGEFQRIWKETIVLYSSYYPYIWDWGKPRKTSVRISGVPDIYIFQRVLTMVYNIRHYWDFVLCPSSGILKNWSRLSPSNGPNKVGASHPFTWERKQIQFPKRFVLYNTGRWTKSINSVIPTHTHTHTCVYVFSVQWNGSSDLWIG
jgi:hypothetical protein